MTRPRNSRHAGSAGPAGLWRGSSYNTEVQPTSFRLELAAAMLSAVVVSAAAPRGHAEAIQPHPQAPSTQVDPKAAGVPIYPNAEFLESFDAGRGQRFFLYGTNTPYDTVVQYYKAASKSSGRELFKAPAMQQFDLGRFDEGTMAYPPSVLVKDYTWMDSPGYLHVSGTTEKRYKTIIQIVLPPQTI